MRFVLVVAAAFFCAGAAAQPAFPAGSLAWISMDEPGGFRGDPAAVLTGDAVSNAMGALLGDEETGRAMGSLAAEATRQGTPWSICVMEYRAEQTTRPRRIHTLSAYFAAEAPSDVNAFGAALPRPPGREGAVAPGGKAGAFDRGEPWQRIEWREEAEGGGGGFTVGFGPGSLEHALAQGEPEARAWAACQTALGEHGRPVLSAWVDLNGFRRAMPEGFTGTPAGRLLAACGVENGRGLLLVMHEAASGDEEHPAVYSASLAWSARSEPLDTAHRTDLAETAWPADLPPLAPGPKWVMAVRSNWGKWIEGVLNAWVDSGTEGEQKSRAARRTSWMRDRGGPLAGLIRMSGPYVILSGSDRGLEARCTTTGDADRFHAYARGVFNSLGKTVRFDPSRRVWRWTLDRSALEWGNEAGALLVRPAPPSP